MKQRRVILCLEHSQSTKMGKLTLVFTKHCRQHTRLEDTEKEYSCTPFFKKVEVLPSCISLKGAKEYSLSLKESTPVQISLKRSVDVLLLMSRLTPFRCPILQCTAYNAS